MASKYGRRETTIRGGVARNEAQKPFHQRANTTELAVNARIFQLTLNLCGHSLVYLWFGVSLKPNATTNLGKTNTNLLSVIVVIKNFVLLFANFKVKLNLNSFCL